MRKKSNSKYLDDRIAFMKSQLSRGEQGETPVKLNSRVKGDTIDETTFRPRNQKRADSLKGSFSDAFSSGKMAHPESLTYLCDKCGRHLSIIEDDGGKYFVCGFCGWKNITYPRILNEKKKVR
jgi:DNA-directed RNA polymerase subunit RPC12/RpoP